VAAVAATLLRRMTRQHHQRDLVLVGGGYYQLFIIIRVGGRVDGHHRGFALNFFFLLLLLLELPVLMLATVRRRLQTIDPHPIGRATAALVDPSNDRDGNSVQWVGGWCWSWDQSSAAFRRRKYDMPYSMPCLESVASYAL
jgi:hypothetical protein